MRRVVPVRSALLSARAPGPSNICSASAIVLPWLQLLSGIALISARFVKGSSLWIFVMLLAFQIAVASALFRGLNISCGCFKSGGDPATWWTFARDTLLLVAAAIQLWKATTEETQSGLWMKK